MLHQVIVGIVIVAVVVIVADAISAAITTAAYGPRKLTSVLC